MSAWQPEIDGIRYRVAGAFSSVFVPGRGAVGLPLRSASSGGPVRVEVRLDGRLADVVQVPSDRWITIKILMPEVPDAPRFRRVDLSMARGRDPEALLVGKVVEY